MEGKAAHTEPFQISPMQPVRSVEVLGTTGPGAEIICGLLVWKFSVNQDYSSSSFSLKLLCLKGVFKCFPVISFQSFLRCGAPYGLPKVRVLGPWPPGPLKTTTVWDVLYRSDIISRHFRTTVKFLFLRQE